MAKYIESTLIAGEKIILSPALHPIVYLKPVIRFGLYLLIGLVIGLTGLKGAWEAVGILLAIFGAFELCCIAYNYLYYPRVEMAVTNKRVVHKTGIIGVDSEELQWNRIESIEIRQGIIGRLLNYGNVCFSGTGVSFVQFETVKNPRAVKAKAAEILSK